MLMINNTTVVIIIIKCFCEHRTAGTFHDYDCPQYYHHVFLGISPHPKGFDVSGARPKQPAQAETACSSARPKQSRSRNSLYEAERNSIDRFDWVFPRVGDHIVMVLVPELLHSHCHLAPLLLCDPQLAVLFRHADDLGVLVPSAVDVAV